MNTNNNTTLCLSGREPILIAPTNLCSPGFYCPNNTAVHPPQYCPPTDECLITRLQEEDNICQQPQGIYEPVICPPKYYCPEGGKQLIPCPGGHYCPLGSTKPSKCLPLSVCRPNSDRETPLLGFFCCLLIDIALLLLWIWPWARRTWRKKRGVVAHLDGRTNMHTSGFELDPRLHDGVLEPTPTIEFKNVSLRHPSADGHILFGVNGVAAPGSFLGIMGASGSGKTSLVNVLAGKIKATSGTLLVNGVESSLSDSKRSKNLLQFVPQDDIVHRHLTVWENILHSARIRLGGVLNDNDIQQHVENIIHGLSLTKVRNTVVGDHERRGISGGERKRVSIAVELVAAPRILVLDEPTSGLDALAALSIVKLLRSLSRHSITVICVIHQPRVEIFNELDDLLLLEAGKQAYFGQASAAQTHFETLGYQFDLKLNPADILMDVIAGEALPSCGGNRCMKDVAIQSQSKLTANPLSSDNEKALSSDGMPRSHLQSCRRMAPWYRQVYLCFCRDIIQQSRQLSVFFTELTGAILTGILIGLAVYTFRGQLFLGLFQPPFHVLSSAVDYEMVPRLALLTCFAISFAAAAPSVSIFSEETLVFQRESSSGHSESAYFVGKVLSSLLRNTISAFHYTSFYMVLATPFVPFQKILGLNLLYFYCVYGIGSAVAALTKRENGPLVCLLATIIIAVFGGTAPRLTSVKEWHLDWFWYTSPGLWLSEAYFSEHVSPFGYLFDEAAAEAFTGYTLHRPGFDVGMILLIGTLYRVIGCVLMVVRARTNWW